ncbi:6415_t:CDS:2, partial [Funneliformis caledonium]
VLMRFKIGKPHTYSVIDEIKSLFYVFMHIACDGIVSWKKHSDLSTSIAIKCAIYFSNQNGPRFGNDLLFYLKNSMENTSGFCQNIRYEKNIRSPKGYFDIEGFEVFQIIEKIPILTTMNNIPSLDKRTVIPPLLPKRSNLKTAKPSLQNMDKN